MGKSIKKLSHASLHLFHKIGLIHVAIILMVVGIKIKGSPAILSILPISSLLLLLILLIGILIEVVVLVVKGPLWISILMVALMRLVPVVPRLLVLLYVRDSVIHSIDILAHKISISIVLDTVMVAVDSHRHLRSLVFKFVIIPVDLDAGPTILDHYSIAISTDRYHQGATLNKYLILIARNVDISTTILQSMLRIIVKNVHPRLIIIINIQQVSITPTHRNEMSLGGKGRLYTALKLEVYAQ